MSMIMATMALKEIDYLRVIIDDDEICEMLCHSPPKLVATVAKFISDRER